jgi:YspA, cpYpsA-related SLOG family
VIVLVCGGRTYDDRKTVFRVLDRANYVWKISLVVTGAAPGADQLAGEWAAARGIPLVDMPAHWKKYGKSAGPFRNSWMLKFLKPQRVVAFPGESGTENMCKQAESFGLKPIRV